MRPDPYVDNTPLEKTFEDLFVGADGNKCACKWQNIDQLE